MANELEQFQKDLLDSASNESRQGRSCDSGTFIGCR